jgi:antitoxin (DNA-binding transcriptional repressor) of toxin-antitoxin stability system
MTIQVKDLSPQLIDLLERVKNGEEIIIQDADLSVAKISAMKNTKPKQRILGGEENTIKILEGFDEPLTDFAEYQ